MKKPINPLTPGDVIRTRPARGFHGCAVVLSARDGSATSHPMCHIATTRLIRKRRYAWASVTADELAIVTVRPLIRVARHDWRQSADERTCIGIYTLTSAAGLDIIARVDPAVIHAKPLTFAIGDGTRGRFPLCGPIPQDLGIEAVEAWRESQDAARFARGMAATHAAFERAEDRRLATARGARRERQAAAKVEAGKPPRRGTPR